MRFRKWFIGGSCADIMLRVRRVHFWSSTAPADPRSTKLLGGVLERWNMHLSYEVQPRAVTSVSRLWRRTNQRRASEKGLGVQCHVFLSGVSLPSRRGAITLCMLKISTRAKLLEQRISLHAVTAFLRGPGRDIPQYE